MIYHTIGLVSGVHTIPRFPDTNTALQKKQVFEGLDHLLAPRSPSPSPSPDTQPCPRYLAPAGDVGVPDQRTTKSLCLIPTSSWSKFRLWSQSLPQPQCATKLYIHGFVTLCLNLHSLTVHEICWEKKRHKNGEKVHYHFVSNFGHPSSSGFPLKVLSSLKDLQKSAQRK